MWTRNQSGSPNIFTYQLRSSIAAGLPLKQSLYRDSYRNRKTILKDAYLFLEVIGLIFPEMKAHQSYSEFAHFLKQTKRMKSKHLDHSGIFFFLFLIFSLLVIYVYVMYG